jgi:MFS transporter, putative metabolite:H+ symporter
MLERLERQEKLTANQWKIIATANVGDMLDFFDFFLIGYVLAFILKDWQITYGQSALILISAGLGLPEGAAVRAAKGTWLPSRASGPRALYF